MRGFVTLMSTLAVTAVTLAGCLEPEEPAGTGNYAVTRCDADGACAAGETCRDGLCLFDCAADADCPAGALCAEGSCWAGESGACDADAACAAGEACVDGVCVAYAPVLGCAAADDCPAGAICVAGECVFDAVEPEICNGLDDDLDGLVDEGCESEGCGAAGVYCAAGEVCLDGVCVPAGVDADGDGFAAGVDCDDSDVFVNPAAFEHCDGLDNDCDGEVDEGCAPVECAADDECAAGQVCVDSVCQDVELPCEAEICNGVDDDCDGVVDEGCEPEGCGAAGVYCAAGEVCLDGVCVSAGDDADGDGFAADVDCDDADAAVNPAAFENCDGLDNDCDGEVDEGCTSGSGGCGADDDCAAGEVCVEGVCVAD